MDISNGKMLDIYWIVVDLGDYTAHVDDDFTASEIDDLIELWVTCQSRGVKSEMDDLKTAEDWRFFLANSVDVDASKITVRKKDGTYTL